MSNRPKILRIFDDTTKGDTYSKVNNPITVDIRDHSLVVVEDIKLESGAVMLTFKAPCNCSSVTHLIVGSGSSERVYELVDARGKSISTGYSFGAGSIVSVFVDCHSTQAYLVNGANITRDDPIILSDVNYGDELPTDMTPGRLFFLKAPKA